MRAIDWRHKDVWAYRTKSFCVEVSRHSETRLDGEVENLWCIYAYVWEKHPAFKLFNRHAGPFEQPSFDVHSYPSFYRPHINKEGGITSHQIGWDYNHDGDSHYLELTTKDQAGSVFWDAQNLIKQLEEWDND